MNSMMFYSPIQWMALRIVVCRKKQLRRGGGQFNGVGLTITSFAQKRASLIVEIKPRQSAPGFEASFCHGQAV